MFSVVIVNWNSGNHLSNCINSITKFNSNLIDKIVVVDNNSNDNSIKQIKNFPNIDLILSPLNLGFSKACNLGAKNTNSEFIIFLNPDAALFENTISNLKSTLDNNVNNKIGILGIQLIDEDKNITRTCSRSPNFYRLLTLSIGIDKYFPVLGCIMSEWNHAHTKIVDQVIGAFFVVKTNLFNILGGFDERFFVYYDEVDFSLRLKKLGYKTLYDAENSAFHFGGGSSNQVKAKRLFYSLRSRLQYINKHFNFLENSILFTFLFTFEFFIRIFFSIFKFSYSNFKETIIAYIYLLKWVFNKNYNV
jgi:GT2 family glycosyltransferase